MSDTHKFYRRSFLRKSTALTATTLLAAVGVTIPAHAEDPMDGTPITINGNVEVKYEWLNTSSISTFTVNWTAEFYDANGNKLDTIWDGPDEAGPGEKAKFRFYTPEGTATMRVWRVFD